MQKKFLQFVSFFGILFVMLFMVSCANIVAPTGGPKDETPPIVKSFEPKNYSSNFKERKIKITFNEFVLLADQANQIVVSPPPAEEFEYIIRGKSLLINLPKELKDSVTYTIYFGESIKDITEGNTLTGLEYAFSTCNYIDSLSVSGSVTDAFTLEPSKNVYVLLYRSVADSAPMKHKPDYVTKTNANGLFSLSNLANIPYKIFVLSDMNNDLMYNLPTEAIAFTDSLITPQYIPRKKDTVASKKDSITVKKDSLPPPTVIKQTHLKMFVQTDTMQKLLQARSNKYGQFKLVFKYPTTNLNIQVHNRILPANWKLDEYSIKKDTLIAWLLNPAIDTLKFSVFDNGVFIDSVDLSIKQKSTENASKKPSGKGSPIDDNSVKPIVYFNAKTSCSLPYYLPLKISVSNPVDSTDFSKIILSEKIDSNYKAIPIEIKASETGIKRHFFINQKWKAKTTYQILVLPGAFKNIYGSKNDSTKITFTPNTVEDYGRLLFTFKTADIHAPYILQLLNDSKAVIAEKSTIKSGQVIFDNLLPGSYHLRIIRDANNNGKWDSGDYLRKIQPEAVFSFPEVITIRANWDSDFEFTL